MASPEIRRLHFQAPTGEFNLSRLERVIYGPGKIAALKDEMERRGLKRAVVVTTDVVAKLPDIKRRDRSAGFALRVRVRGHRPARAARHRERAAKRDRACGCRLPGEPGRRQPHRFQQGCDLWPAGSPRTGAHRGADHAIGGGIYARRRRDGRDHARQERRVRYARAAAHGDQRSGADAGRRRTGCGYPPGFARWIMRSNAPTPSGISPSATRWRRNRSRCLWSICTLRSPPRATSNWRIADIASSHRGIRFMAR